LKLKHKDIEGMLILDKEIIKLKSLISRTEVKRFVDQLNAISSIPISIINANKILVYENGDIIDGEKPLSNAEDSYECPIIIDEIQIGSIIAHNPHISQELGLLGEMLSDRLSHDLKVDNLASEVVNNYQELNLFYEIGNSLSSVLDVETISEIALKQAVNTIGSKMASVMLLDENKEQLRIASSIISTDKNKTISNLNIKIENSIYKDVIENRVPVVIENPEKHPNFEEKINNAEIATDLPFMCVPVCAKDDVFGVISMSGKLSDEPFTSVDTKLLYAIASQIGVSLSNASLYDDLDRLFIDTVEALAVAVEVKDPYTHGHCKRVAEYSIAIGEEFGLPGRELRSLRLAGFLHDIGKIGISESILRKSTWLDEEELMEMRNHPVKGAEIIGHIQQMKEIATWIKHHHERYDGRGYPDGLQGEDIPFPSRIISVGDAYDAITSNRFYSSADKHDNAVVRLQLGSGSYFDPEVVDVFLELIREDAYEKYLEVYDNYDGDPMQKLTRVAYYRVEYEISSILMREALENSIPESERVKLQELRDMILRN
jgi:putative nucleotidyltransferase with HDIG domain